MTREEAYTRFRENEHEGWLVLLDILYDNKPPQVEITEIFQKWGGLKTEFRGEDLLYAELSEQVYNISAFMCERCGRSARTVLIDGWETTLCHRHYEENPAKEKYYPAK